MDASRIPCDFQGCPVTFTRQQDHSRHKREVHGDPKQCPWCEYTTKRDGRMLDHIDENHRPRKQKSRYSVDSVSQPAPKQSEGFRVKDKHPAQALDDIPIQGQAVFRQSGSGAPQNKRATSQQAGSSFEDRPILPAQVPASSPFQNRYQMTHGMDNLGYSRTNQGLPMRLHPSVAQVVKTSRDGLVMSEQSSSKNSAASNYSSSMSNDMSTARHGPLSQSVRPSHHQAFQSSQPIVHSKPTHTQFYEYPMDTNPAPQQFFAPGQNIPSFGPLMPPVSSPHPSYSPMSNHMSPQTNSPSYPQSISPNPNKRLVTTQFGQDESLVFLTDEEYEEYEEYEQKARSTGWQ